MIYLQVKFFSFFPTIGLFCPNYPSNNRPQAAINKITDSKNLQTVLQGKSVGRMVRLTPNVSWSARRLLSTGYRMSECAGVFTLFLLFSWVAKIFKSILSLLLLQLWKQPSVFPKQFLMKTFPFSKLVCIIII